MMGPGKRLFGEHKGPCEEGRVKGARKEEMKAPKRDGKGTRGGGVKEKERHGWRRARAKAEDPGGGGKRVWRSWRSQRVRRGRCS